MKPTDTFFARWTGPCLALAGIGIMLLIGSAIERLIP